MPKEYLQAPNFDIPPPPKGPIKLGHILVEPTEPRYPLNEHDIIQPLESEKHTQTAEGFSATRSQLGGKSFKLWAKVADLLPIGAGASDTRTNQSTDVFAIDTVKTTFFLPNKGYLENSIKSDDVKDYLEGKRWGANVYIIVGLKVAVGASVTTRKVNDSETAVEGSAGFGGNSVGAAAGMNGSLEDATDVEKLGDFVLAYQLRKILYKKGKPLKHQAYNTGAVFGADKGSEATSEGDLDIEGLEEEDLVPDGLTWEGVCHGESVDERIWIRDE